MSWLSFRVEPASGNAVARDEVLAALFAAGAQGVQEDGSALVTHFPPETNVEAVARAVRSADPDARLMVGKTPEVDWSEAWKGSLGAQQVGELAVVPPWLAEGRDPSRTVVVDPGMAFGTGDHPTTRAVARLMQRVIHAGDAVADLGAGSAVLAIAAAKLGARYVAAVELDPDAIGNAIENVARNGVEDVVRVIEGDAIALVSLLAPLDLILANIVSSVHVSLLPAMAGSLTPHGHAILAGILVEERATLVELLEYGGWKIDGEDVEDIWWSATISRR